MQLSSLAGLSEPGHILLPAFNAERWVGGRSSNISAVRVRFAVRSVRVFIGGGSVGDAQSASPGSGERGAWRGAQSALERGAWGCVRSGTNWV